MDQFSCSVPLFFFFLQLQVINKLLRCGVKGEEIIVLTPYRAQCHLISEGLESQGLSHISVMSIVKSQGKYTHCSE